MDTTRTGASLITTSYPVVQPKPGATSETPAAAAPKPQQASTVNLSTENGLSLDNTQDGSFDPIQQGIFSRQLQDRVKASNHQNSGSNQLADSLASILQALKANQNISPSVFDHIAEQMNKISERLGELAGSALQENEASQSADQSSEVQALDESQENEASQSADQSSEADSVEPATDGQESRPGSAAGGGLEVNLPAEREQATDSFKELYEFLRQKRIDGEIDKGSLRYIMDQLKTLRL